MGTGDDEEESLEVTGPSGEQGGEQDMVEEEVQQVYQDASHGARQHEPRAA